MNYRTALLDWLACAAGGRDEPAARAARDLGSGLSDRVAAAGTAGHVLDFDDTYLPGLAHLSAPTAPAALVLGAELGRSTGEVLDAYAAGFEAMGSLAAAAHPTLYESGWHPTAVCGTAGAAVAAARVLGLEADGVRSAAALGLLRAGGLRAAFGSDGKSLQVGLAAAAGVQAARLAAAGARVPFERAADGFEAVYGVRPPDPLTPAGGAIEENWIKPWPCCLQSHGAIEAALGAGSVSGPVSVVVHPVSLQAASYDADVADGLQAKFSIPYLTAFTLLHGAPCVGDFSSVDEEARRLAAERISVSADPSLLESEALLRADGREVRVEAAQGSPGRPLSAEAHVTKLRDLAGDGLNSALDDLDRPAAELLAGAGMSFPIEHPHLVRHIRHEESTPADRKRLGLVVLCGAMFISAVDTTIVNIALPDISEDLNAGMGELQWVLDGFLVCLAGTLLVGSGLADRFGRRRVFLAGFSGFAATSILAALAQTPVELIGARVLMGASAACVLPPALSLIAVMFTPEERPGALAIWASVAGVGLAAGPVLGGILVPSVGWQAVFLVNVPFAIVAVPLGLRSLPESTRPGAPPLDLVGAALSIVALASIVFTLIEGVDAGWTSPEVMTTAVVGIGSGIAFVRVELARRSPLFDVRVLTRPAVIAGAAAIVAMYIAFLGVLFLLPQYLQYVHDRSPLTTALILTPLGLATIATARFNEGVVKALGMRRVIAGGLLAMAGSIALLLLLGSTTSVVVVMISMGLFGAIIPLTIAPATTVIMDDLGEEKAGDGGAVNQLARQVGGALGVAIIGSVFAAVYASRVDFRLAGLSDSARSRAGESIEEARDVVSGTPTGVHEQLLGRIDDSFDVAARVGFGVAVGLLLVAAVVAWVMLRDVDADAG